jgi:hypothetical protein
MRSVLPWQRQPDAHIPDEQLQALLDGEIGSRQAARLQAHLAHCWSCQTRMDKLKAAIAAFMDCRRAAIREEIPSPPRTWTGFSSRLRQEAGAAGTRPVRPLVPLLRYASAGVAAVLIGLAAWAAPATSIWTQKLLETLFPPQRQISQSARLRASPPPPPPELAVVPARPPRPHREKLLAPAPPRISATELDAAEVDAWYALHRAASCDGEQIEVVRNPTGDFVQVRGLVASDSRRQELTAALDRVPHLRLEIRTFEEAVRDLPLAPAEAADPPRVEHVRNSRRAIENGSAPWLRPEAAPQFLEFSRDAVSLASAGLRHAWALRRLGEAFPPDRAAGLPLPSRRLLAAMALDHAARWQGVLQQFRGRLAGVLVQAESPSMPIPTSSGIPQLFEQAVDVDRLTRALFADSDVPPADPQRDLPALLATLAALDGELTTPDELVREFAAAPLEASGPTRSTK